MKNWLLTGLVLAAATLTAGAVNMDQMLTQKAVVEGNVVRNSVKQGTYAGIDFKLNNKKISPGQVLVFEARVKSTDPQVRLAVRFRVYDKWTYTKMQATPEWSVQTLPLNNVKFESTFGGGSVPADIMLTRINFYSRTDIKADSTLELRNIRFEKGKTEFLEPAKTERDLGRRPANGAVLLSSPAVFVWKEQPAADFYTLEYARDEMFTREKHVLKLKLNAHCGNQPMASGTWYWRVRADYGNNSSSDWSKVNRFEIAPDAQKMCLPEMAEILKRIPAKHPRLYLRPEQVAGFKAQFDGKLKPEYEDMISSCDAMVKEQHPVWEPGPYNGKKGEPQWTASWRKAYGQADRVCYRMAQTAFGWLMTGKPEYAAESKRLLKAVLSWDPAGYSRMRYNDEAGMPILRYLARTYTFLYDALTPEERAECIRIMRIRGNEAYSMLCPRILYAPFDSHANRMYYFLGEAGIAFIDVIPEAEKWLEFSLLYFFCNYPVWGDEDGNWHEGPHYWTGYMNTFLDWADVMKNILQLPALAKPYFKNAGNFLLYEELPGSLGYGWGDFAELYHGGKGVPMMQVLAAQSGNPYWKWYVEQVTDKKGTRVTKRLPYVAMLRASYPEVKSKMPVDLPSSRLFRGNGIAVMNSTLLSAAEAVQVQLKCGAQFGNYSHGFESANTFLLNAFGERLLIRSGTRDCYGSDYHRNYMWATQSQNNILVNGKGQIKRACRKMGKILAFSTTPELDRVMGEAADCYEGGILKNYTREILFRKPSAILIIDRVEAKEPVKLDFLLHGRTAFGIQDQHHITQAVGKAACTIDLMWPENLNVSQTNETNPPIIDPNHLHRKGKDHHLTASPDGRAVKTLFITLIRPYKAGSAVPEKGTITQTDGGFSVKVPMEDGKDWVVNISR